MSCCLVKLLQCRLSEGSQYSFGSSELLFIDIVYLLHIEKNKQN